MIAWGTVNSAIPVASSAWLTKGLSDEPESGGGLIVGAIQLSILLGAAFGGSLLDHLSIVATLVGGTVLLLLASLIIGNGDRIKPTDNNAVGQEFHAPTLKRHRTAPLIDRKRRHASRYRWFRIASHNQGLSE